VSRRELRHSAIRVVVAQKKPQPSLVVKTAKRRREEADEVWCVFDRDEHPDFDSAIEEATRKGLLVAASNASFELWLLLHFQDCTRHEERGRLVQLLREHVDYRKAISFGDFREGIGDAVRRARALEERAGALEEPRRNPTTGVWRLVAAIRGESA